MTPTIAKQQQKKPSSRRAANSKHRNPVNLQLGRPPTATPRRPSLSSKKTHQVVNEFHNLTKQLTRAEAAGSTDVAAELRKRLERLGGLKAYQRASIQGQAIDRGGDSSVVLMDWLHPYAATIKAFQHAQGRKLKMLEVGALSTKNACSKSGLFEMERIDLFSQTEGIMQQDFMHRPLPTAHHKEVDYFDLISLSLVLNFVPDALGRGEMLKRTTQYLDQRRARRSEEEDQQLQDVLPALFLVLPVACIKNSRYTNEERLTCMMASLGYVLVRVKQTPKLFYCLWQLRDEPAAEHGQKFAKVEVNPGVGRNNFCIVMN